MTTFITGWSMYLKALLVEYLFTIALAFSDFLNIFLKLLTIFKTFCLVESNVLKFIQSFLHIHGL